MITEINQPATQKPRRNKTMTQYTSAYIDGIKEGRELFTQFGYLDANEEYESCKRLMRTHSGAMKDFFKGQRDFWKNQIKKTKGQ